MASVVTDGNIIVDRDYSDNFSIKETAMNKLGPKYFDEVNLVGLNVGALGFTLEQIANITEDAFNTSSILMNEAFPNRATIPESIYTHAAIFQIDGSFVDCASCSFVMMLQQKEILENGALNNGKIIYYIDKKTVINVEGIPFTLDYDIKIEAQKKQLSGSDTEYNYSAQYIIDYENCISGVNDPYLKIRKTTNGYLIIQFTAHQVERTELTDTIISNTKVNYPVLDFEFNGKLAGFDIYYKAPSDKEYTQLTKKIMFSIPIKTPFCYYRLKGENVLSITFSPKDGYFQPAFNSEIKIVLYTTLGSEGNFEVYNGSNYEFQLYDDVYPYNKQMTIAVKTVSDSKGGTDGLDLEALRALTVESYSTATEISTEYDIMKYFYDFKYRYGNEILVIKRRDDVTERLFSAFLLIKNTDYIYPTNTLNLDIVTSDFDISDQNKRFTLQPGHVFIYKEDSMNTIEIVPDVMCYDTEKVAELMEEHKFVYTNPYLISMTKNPNLIGLYKNIVNQTATLDYISSNEQSFTQFITSKCNLKRDLNKDQVYELSLSIVPSSSVDNYISGIDNGDEEEDITDNDTINNNTTNNINRTKEVLDEIREEFPDLEEDINKIEDGIDTSEDETNDEENEETPDSSEPEYTQNDVRVIAGIMNHENIEVGYIELFPTAIDPDDSTAVTFTAKIKTTDYVTSDGKFIITNAVNPIHPGVEVYVPISDVTVNIYIMYYDAIPKSNKFTPYFDDMEMFILTNTYSTIGDNLTFVQPMNMMRSTVFFSNIGTEQEPILNANLSLLPMVKADIVNNRENFDVFIDRISANYQYLEECLPKLRNNTHLDIKFYNTYGKSVNYYIGDNKELIDTINISIEFKLVIVDGVDFVGLNESVKIFIKDFIEKLNSTGNNDLYISNLIKAIENEFPEIHHLKFLGINAYSTDYQTISVRETDLNNLSKEERRMYVPEMLVVDKNNIKLSLISIKNN